MTIQEEYEKVCFACEERRKELLDFHPDIFTLQPRINEAIEELHALELRKAELEKQIGG